ncbi:MAG: DUF929 family protein [Thermoplasmataceae archaeon]
MNAKTLTMKLSPVIIATIIVVAGLGIPYGLGIVSFNHSASSSTANITIPAGQFYKVSNTDYAPPGQIDIYLTSWYGCPIGAADSWFIYDYFSNFEANMTPYIHPQNVPYGTPGLLFKNLSFYDKNISMNVDFFPYYLYNLHLNGSAAGFNNLSGGTPIPTNLLISTGISELKGSSFPTPVINTMINATTIYDLNGTNLPSAYTHPAGKPNKINTIMVITGVGGTWILNRFMISPSSLKESPSSTSSYTYQYMLQNYSGIQSVVNANSNFTKAMEYVSATVPCT